MDIRPIRSDEDLAWALSEVEKYFNAQPEPGTPEADRFDVLAALIEHYEAKRWPRVVDATDYLLASPANEERLKRSIEQFD